VTVPQDNESLRFELPAPQPPETPAPIAAAAPTAASQPTPLAATSTSSVVPAAYVAPPSDSQPVVNASFAEAVDAPAATTPWRSPQIAPLATPWPITPQAAAQPAAPAPTITYPPTLAAQQFASPMMAPTMPGAPVLPTMDVQLRAVPSPPPQPVEVTAPRIRLPGYPTPQTTMSPGTSGPSTSFTSPTLAYDPSLGSLVVVNSPGASPQSATPSSDGFRPRTSMR
jgi:hypothetical protein